jgi:hypothetical protein
MKRIIFDNVACVKLAWHKWLKRNPGVVALELQKLMGSVASWTMEH